MQDAQIERAEQSVVLFGANDQPLELVGAPEVIETSETETKQLDVLEELAALRAKLDLLVSGKAQVSAAPSAPAVPGIPKNHRPVTPDPNRRYVRLGPLATWGKIPQQQKDLADMLTESMDIGKEWTEEEVFTLLEENVAEKDSLAKSCQSVSYLFCYYRGLKNDSKHAGFISRGFLRQIG